MDIYTVCASFDCERAVVADDMILTLSAPTTAGSAMLDGYTSLIESEALVRLTSAGYKLCGKTHVGELAIDLVGETCYSGPLYKDGKAVNAAAESVLCGDAVLALCLDANGSVRRAAAQSGLCGIKPTYGTVSRFGVIPVACSGDTVSLMAKTAAECAQALEAISAYDAKDGTCLPDSMREVKDAPVKRVALLTSMLKGADADVTAAIEAAVAALEEKGITVERVEDSVICLARAAWNILRCAELCNNVSRYDGVKYGHRAESFNGIDELYTNSRTEGFGDLLKTAIIYGSETLSTENYMPVYDKALRVRRVIVEAFASLFERFDAVLMPACSTMGYTKETIEAAPRLVFEENYYTAPASISGLPVAVACGVQLVGPAFSDKALLDAAAILAKEDR